MGGERILVTGGGGFIGRHLVNLLLRKGRLVTVLDDLSTGRMIEGESNVRFIVGDIADPAFRSEALEDCCALVHLAAIASVPRCEGDPSLSERVNQRAAINLFDEAAKAGVHAMVHASTSALYGVPEFLPISEFHPIAPIGVYGLDKQAAELAITSRDDVGACALRLFNVYGIGQPSGSPYSGVLTIFSERLRNQQPLTVFGDGMQTRDFVHVSDVVQAFSMVLESLEQEGTKSPVHAQALNVCSGQTRTLLETIEAFGDAIGVEPVVKFNPPREGDILHSSGTSEALMNALGWSAQMNFTDGLRSLVS
ncbi:MAG TPA: NAD-dependent epimerase/dehydratase family protein [Candidatus Thalassarchaeaceae archaeon]|nr:MAG TPA: NAD-dependent epimerase/dehydratase family protein [Candidatus Poseidoniales archaeon]HII49144.1 NAD-dependent epimerase/dehydratase family protein [Candidatus Thalassarchaeaceae archaeon]